MSKEPDKSTDNKKDTGGIIQIVVTIIGGIVAIVVAIIGLMGILAQIKANSTPTQVVITVPVLVPAQTETISIPDTPTSELIFEPFLLPTSTLETNDSLTGQMYVVLTSNRSKGKPPLEVVFDARDSYFIAPDGTRYDCGACNYTWRIREGGVEIYGPENTDGKLEYIFGGRGNYFVSVYVCRSGSDIDCEGSGAQIVVE